MGRPPKMTPAEICRIIALHPEPIITSSDVYEDMDMTQRAAQDRLDTLVDKGYLDAKKVGARAKVYWLTARGRNSITD